MATQKSSRRRASTGLQALLESPLTVTHILEDLAGELLVADVLRQYRAEAGVDNDLDVRAGHDVTHRCAVLRGSTTGRPYLYAESVFVAPPLPEQVSAELEQTAAPIGRILVAHGLTFDRQPLPQPGPLGAAGPGSLPALEFEPAWSRAYRLMIDGQPAFAIAEWFAPWVIQALRRQAHA